MDTIKQGGAFLLKETASHEVFTPEEFSEEQVMIRSICEDFLKQQVSPLLEEIDQLQEGLMPSLLDKAASLGLLGVSVPEDYGGFGHAFTTSLLVTEALGAGHSFAVSFAAHTGIGTLPVLYYGSESQKQKYLPGLVAGSLKASYCLTEPGAGSDANAGKTSAVLNELGTHYLINGQKMWITNAGFADLFIVFAKIDQDKKLSAFIVEKEFGGIVLSPEEKKMGIKGSSTRQVFFTDCPVPVENLLSVRENGFKIAVNILNIGRLKLAAATVGSAKKVLTQALTYSMERMQFGTRIFSFGAIQHKIGEMAARIFAVESALYRTGNDMESYFQQAVDQGLPREEAWLRAAEEYAVECAILKVWGSEMLDYVVDEGMQIYGGMGYSTEAPMERSYRDARINRIFEGTNEVNRLLLVDMLLKRAMNGKLDLVTPAQTVAKELLAFPTPQTTDLAGWGEERNLLRNMKKIILLITGAAVKKMGADLAKEQEIVLYLADMVGYTYLAESALLRAEQHPSPMEGGGQPLSHLQARLCVYGAIDQVYMAGKNALNAFQQGDELRMLMLGLRRFSKAPAFNAVAQRRKIAEALLSKQQ